MARFVVTVRGRVAVLVATLAASPPLAFALSGCAHDDGQATPPESPITESVPAPPEQPSSSAIPATPKLAVDADGAVTQPQ